MSTIELFPAPVNNNSLFTYPVLFPPTLAGLSHTHRPLISPPHAISDSWAAKCFPQNSFVWEIKKIDSRPHKRNTNVQGLFSIFLETRPPMQQDLLITAVQASPPHDVS